MTRLFIPVFLCLLMACASTQAVPITPSPKAEPAIEAPDPVPVPELDDEGNVNLTVEAPSADWVKIPDAELPEGAVITFSIARLSGYVMIFLQYQKGTDAHKQAQILAIQIALQGGQPMHIHAEPDGSWAWVAYTGETEAGKMAGITDIKRADVDPDLYIFVAGVWAVEHHNVATFKEFETFVDSLKVTPQ